MKAYKGLTKIQDGTLQCHDFKYEVGTTYKYDGDISLCENGFHACHELHQVWQFYPNNGHNVYYEVECEGDVIKNNYHTGKFVCSEIRLVKEVDVSNVAKFDECLSFSEGLGVIKLNDKYSFINTKGEYHLDQWFDHSFGFHEGFSAIEIESKYNYINVKGEFLSDQWFDDCLFFKNGFGRVKLNGKKNFINTKGEILSPGRWFDNCWSFNEGFGVVRINEKYNYIDAKGELLSPEWFDHACDFKEGYGCAKVRLKNQIYWIDKTGKPFEA